MRKTRSTLYPLALALVALFGLAVFGRGAELAEAHASDSFRLSASTYPVNEGDTLNIVIIRTTTGTPTDHLVNLTFVDGTAVTGTHYGATVGSGCPAQSGAGVPFPAASTQVVFQVRTCAAADFLDRTFTVSITGVSSEGVIGTPATATVTIEDVNGPQPPVITSIAPTNGTTLGGTTVTILGSGFTGVDCTPAGGVGVEFGAGNDATSCTLVSPTRIDAVTPAQAAGTVEVTVTTPNGTSSTTGTANDFTYQTPGAPFISSLNPSSGPVGTSVTISGGNFGTNPVVKFGTVTATVTNSSNSTIIATAPDPGTPTRPLVVDVSVTANALTSSNTGADNFTYANISVTGLSPSTGPEGINVTITGTGFVSAPTVRFGGITATVVSFTQTQIVATVPVPDSSARPIERDVIVTIGATESANTAADNFTYVDVIVTSISPTSGPAGATVVISGSGFTGQPTVTFGQVAASVTTFSPTSVTVVAPTQAIGTVSVSVRVGTVTADDIGTGDNFTYTIGVSVSGLDPNKGPTSGGNSVKITGGGFAAGATITVSFGGTAGTSVNRVSDTELTVIAPAHAAGVVSVIVSVNGALSGNTIADDYTYANIPIVTSLTPSSGIAGGTTIVKITGENFTEGAVVKFGAIEAVRTILSDTEINAVAPSAAPPGTVDVTVTNAAGTSLVGPQTVFTFTGMGGTPLVSSLSPANTPINTSGTVVTITGVNFATPATVKFGGVDATNVQVLSSTQIKATAPARATAGVVDVTVTTTFGTSTGAGTGNDFTYGSGTTPPPTGETTTYQLFVRFTLITWDGRDNITPFEALRGLESPDVSATNSILNAATAVFYWSNDGSGCPSLQPCFQAFFPSGQGVPGANNLAALFRGRAYWVAVSFNTAWTIQRGQ